MHTQFFQRETCVGLSLNTEAFEDPLSVDVNTTGAAVFRLASDRVFSRARILLDPQTVSTFGEISSSDN